MYPTDDEKRKDSETDPQLSSHDSDTPAYPPPVNPYAVPAVPPVTPAPPVAPIPPISPGQPAPHNSQANTQYRQYPGYENQQRQQAGTSWNMYSPGMYANQPSPRDRNAERAAARAQGTQKSRLGSFVRAACLVLVCVMLSAASTYAIMEYRIQNGDFSAPTQVVLGAPQPQQTVDVSTDTPENPDKPAPLISSPDNSMSAQDIYDIALTQVVGINVTAPDTSQFFGTQGSVPSVTGSGFIVSEDGYILTNHHVIDMAHRGQLPISVVLHDGTTYDASVVGFDATNDVALLKVDATGLNPSVIGNSNELRVGQDVYAVGNPFGDLVYTMTDGIVSALDRIVSLDGKSISTFQFSAAVNSGNSGGPVYNAHGEVIGIVTAKLIRGNVEGIGFAIPINDAIDIATALIEHGYISDRPLLGITARPITDGQIDFYNIVPGVLVRSVSPGSAAEKAGIQTNDIITAIGEQEIDSMEALRFALRSYKAGDTEQITVFRRESNAEGEIVDNTIELTITFDEDLSAGRPQQTEIPTPEVPDPYDSIPSFP